MTNAKINLFMSNDDGRRLWKYVEDSGAFLDLMGKFAEICVDKTEEVILKFKECGVFKNI